MRTAGQNAGGGVTRGCLDSGPGERTPVTNELGPVCAFPPPVEHDKELFHPRYHHREFRFDLSKIPEGEAVTAAEFRIYKDYIRERFDNETFRISVFQVLQEHLGRWVTCCRPRGRGAEGRRVGRARRLGSQGCVHPEHPLRARLFRGVRGVCCCFLKLPPSVKPVRTRGPCGPVGICGPSGSDGRLGPWGEGDGGEEETLSPVHHSETQHTTSGSHPKWLFGITLGGPNPQTKNKQAESSALRTSGGQEPEAGVGTLSFLRHSGVQVS